VKEVWVYSLPYLEGLCCVESIVVQRRQKFECRFVLYCRNEWGNTGVLVIILGTWMFE
jgi:hypothetical protein